MRQFDSSILFFCYDFQLHKKLKQAHIRYITKAYSMEGRMYWQYFRTDEVNRIIRQHNGLDN
ncbi:hypothetical protein [Niallia taxi]|uniref:hypothetical protein n=1 Tax=Niallia taxi TaxID=2499688 RepID=UPI0015F646DE|nr:hypothetical protein [Niallia taxi]